MPTSYYPDAEDDEINPQPEEAEGATALLPKSILAGKKFQPGDEIVLKVVRLYDDEVEVEYASAPEGDAGGEDEGGEEDGEDMGDGGMDQMMAGGGPMNRGM
jgi:hypothetical protein